VGSTAHRRRHVTMETVVLYLPCLSRALSDLDHFSMSLAPSPLALPILSHLLQCLTLNSIECQDRTSDCCFSTGELQCRDIGSCEQPVQESFFFFPLALLVFCLFRFLLLTPVLHSRLIRVPRAHLRLLLQHCRRFMSGHGKL